MVRLFLILAILYVILVAYKIIKNSRYKVLNHNRTSKRYRRKGHYGLVQLEGNMTRPIPGDSTKTSMVFWYDRKEEQKIHSDRL